MNTDGLDDSTTGGFQEGSATLRLAASVAILTQDACPIEVLAHARRVFADTIACMIGGLTHPEVECLAQKLHRAGTPERFTGLQAAPSDLALLLGFAGSALELDEGHYAAGGHPAVHAAAAVLAESVQRHVSDEDCILAFLAGYEAGARVGAATRLRPAVHPHGTWGVIGAAVSTAWLRGYTPTQMTDVINVASSLGLATSASAPPRGASVRSAWVGVAARNGLLACDLVQAGVTGEPEGCAVVYGQVLGTAFDTHRLTDRLGEDYLITDNFMKCQASCRETHGAIAAVSSALSSTLSSALSHPSHQGPPKPEHVLRVEIETFADAARLSDVNPVNEMAARFSIPAAVATMMLDGEVGADSFLHERLERPALRALMQRVSVRETPDATEALPARRVCRCRIVLTDGTFIAAEVDAAPGDSVDRLSIGVLRAKIDALCGRSKNREHGVLKARALHRFLG